MSGFISLLITPPFAYLPSTRKHLLRSELEECASLLAWTIPFAAVALHRFIRIRQRKPIDHRDDSIALSDNPAIGREPIGGEAIGGEANVGDEGEANEGESEGSEENNEGEANEREGEGREEDESSGAESAPEEREEGDDECENVEREEGNKGSEKEARVERKADCEMDARAESKESDKAAEQESDVSDGQVSDDKDCSAEENVPEIEAPESPGIPTCALEPTEREETTSQIESAGSLTAMVPDTMDDIQTCRTLSNSSQWSQ